MEARQDNELGVGTNRVTRFNKEGLLESVEYGWQVVSMTDGSKSKVYRTPFYANLEADRLEATIGGYFKVVEVEF